jgi:hypothetical protein
VSQQFEPRVTEQVVDIAAGGGVEVVDAQHLSAIGKQSVAEVASDETGTAGD